MAGIGGAPTPPNPAIRPRPQPSPCASLWHTIAFSISSLQAAHRWATLHSGRALPLRAPPLLRGLPRVAVRVQGLFSIAGAPQASPPLSRALRPQISATLGNPLRGSPALRRQGPALRFATHRRPSRPNPHPLPQPPRTPRGGNPTQAAGIPALRPFPFYDGAPWATGWNACPLLKGG